MLQGQDIDVIMTLNQFHVVLDPRSAPVSPCPLRKAPSQTELDISAPGTPRATRSGYAGRRKLGSRHGWGLGLARGSSGVSQSFSPGDHKTTPRLPLRSSQDNSAVLWEGQRRETNTPQAAAALLSSQESVEEDEVTGEGGGLLGCLNLTSIVKCL